MVTTALVTTAVEEALVPINPRMYRKMWSTYTMEFCSAIKKNKVISFAGRWMELGIILFSKVSQAQKDKYHISSHAELEFLKKGTKVE
jgi:hypothetical protein